MSEQRIASEALDPTGLVQRCVIVQRDEHGFGFTVSGDTKVFVQSVKQGGAAMRAGVQKGDRIIKVNGTLVTNSNHLDVVRLIKSGAYVALTLLGPPPNSPSIAPATFEAGAGGSPWNSQIPPPPSVPPPPTPVFYSSAVITGPKLLPDRNALHDHANQILRNMLKQEEEELQYLCEEYNQHPSPMLLDKKQGAERRASQLRNKLQPDSPDTSSPVRPRSDSRSGYFENIEGRMSFDSQEAESALLSSSGETFPKIIGPEEEDVEMEECLFNESDGPFQDFEKLKERPVHLIIFMRYIFSQTDPNPLLFHLCADVCHQSSPKDCRKLAATIWSLFLEPNAPLKVKLPEAVTAEIDSRLRGAEDGSRNLFTEGQESIVPEIQEQIQDYRNKRMLGLGSLYGENDLSELDSDLTREKQLAERQYFQLEEIISKYEEERSLPMSIAVATYMKHIGVHAKYLRPLNPERSQCGSDKEKWLPFFQNKRKPGAMKKGPSEEKDKKRSSLFRNIGKPQKGTSHSTFHVPLSPTEVRPGNVRHIIQQFENHTQSEPPDPGTPPPSSSSDGNYSFMDELGDPDRSRSGLRLGRSESLKGREEMNRTRNGEKVPRSKSDVDMEAAAEATKLHQSTSSSTSSLSARSLENPTPPYTPKSGRRSVDSPSTLYGRDSPLPNLLEDESGRLSDLEIEPETQNWQQTIGRELVSKLDHREIERQEVINELLVTEFSHMRILRVLDVVFYQPMQRDGIVATSELARIFPNLPRVIEVHATLSEAMRRLRDEGPVIREIGDILLARFDGEPGDHFREVVSGFCSSQSFGLQLIRNKQRKEQRFQYFMMEAERNRECRRLQLKDLLVSEMQRLTKYPLLLENIIKYTDDRVEREKLVVVRECCRLTLTSVNEAVKETENRQRLDDYQRRLDTSSLERANNPVAFEFKNLDLTQQRMIHEGPLTWRVSKEKTIDLLVLLLQDLLVLLQRQDDRLVLKCHSKALGSSDLKQTFSPVIKLHSVLVRAVATDKKALFIISTSELGPQIYELVAATSSERNMWQELLEDAVKLVTMKSGSRALRHSQQKIPQTPVAQADRETSYQHDADRDSAIGSISESEPLLSEVGGQMEEGGRDHPSLSSERVSPGEEEEEEEDQDRITPTLEASYSGLEASPCLSGIAGSALHDVETLRRLIMSSALMVDDAYQGSGSCVQAQCEPTTDQRTEGSAEGHGSKEETGDSSGDAGRFRVVRKEGDGTNAEGAVGLQAKSTVALVQSEDAFEGALDGNTFYLTMPPGPEQTETETGTEMETESSGELSPPETSYPQARLALVTEGQLGAEAMFQPPRHILLNDVEGIFRTIERLTVKLNRLKELESGYQHLLISRDPQTDRGPSPDPHSPGGDPRSASTRTSRLSASASDDGTALPSPR